MDAPGGPGGSDGDAFTSRTGRHQRGIRNRKECQQAYSHAEGGRDGSRPPFSKAGKSLEQVLAAYLKRKGKEAASGLAVEKLAKAAKKKPEDQDTIDVLVDWGDLIPEVTPYLETDAVAGATEFLTERGIAEDSDIWTKVLDEARQMARERGAELVGKRITDKGEIVDNPDARYAITETTRENLRELISKSVDEGWTTTELQHNILQSEDFSAARALTISRTESMYAYNHGKHEAAKGTGQKFKQQIGSGDACEECMENIEAGLIPIDEDFPSGDDCTPIHPNDRCGMGYSESQGDDESEGEE